MHSEKLKALGDVTGRMVQLLAPVMIDLRKNDPDFYGLGWAREAAKGQGWVGTISRHVLRRLVSTIDQEIQKEDDIPGYTSWLRDLDKPNLVDPESFDKPPAPASAPPYIRTHDNHKKVKLGGSMNVKPDGEKEITYQGQAGPGGKLRSPEEILETLNVDIDQYRVRMSETKGYQGYMKGPDDLPITVDLYSYRATIEERAIPRKWIPKAPKIKFCEPKKIDSSDVRKAVFLGDAHFGFYWKDGLHQKLVPLHDRRAIDACFQYIAAEQPEIICIMGDWIDHAATGKHDNEPKYAQTMTPTFHELAWHLGMLRSLAPNARILWTPGNHDVRPERLLARLAPELHGYKPPGSVRSSMSIEALLGPVVREINLEIADDEHLGEEHCSGFWLFDEADNPIWATHGETLGSGGIKLVNNALNLGGEFHRVFGHAHKAAIAHRTLKTRKGPRTFAAACAPCLCHVDSRVPSQKNGKDWQDWQNGVVTANFHPKSGKVFLELSLIEDGLLVMPNGDVYQGRDHGDQIAKDVGIAQLAST